MLLRKKKQKQQQQCTDRIAVDYLFKSVSNIIPFIELNKKEEETAQNRRFSLGSDNFTMHHRCHFIYYFRARAGESPYHHTNKAKTAFLCSMRLSKFSKKNDLFFFVGAQWNSAINGNCYLNKENEQFDETKPQSEIVKSYRCHEINCNERNKWIWINALYI